MTDLTFRSDFTVELEGYMGSDAQIANVARVSTQGMGMSCHPEFTKKDRGLLNMLMRDRHGCYDSDTEVLTRDGWKSWPSVDGSEEFLTYNLSTGRQEYQKASNVIHKAIDGPMVHIKNREVDLLVTPDHRMIAQSYTSQQGVWGSWEIVPAHTFLESTKRVPAALSGWVGDDTTTPEEARFIGFVTGDGSFTGTSIDFRLKKTRKIEFLERLCKDIGVDLSYTSAHKDTYRPIKVPKHIRDLCRKTYNGKYRSIPKEILQGSSTTLRAFLEGYLEADGTLTDKGTYSASTASREFAGQLQELGIKLGIPTSVRSQETEGYTLHTCYHVRFKAGKFSAPRIGWTTDRRSQEVSVQNYSGTVHCVTVPNGTLMVRRNGKVAWCGNTPWESGILQFYIEAPIFVTREFFRHRIASYNEASSRYKEMEPVFYVPDPQVRPLRQIGKPGAYTFEMAKGNQDIWVRHKHVKVAKVAWEEYQDMLELGIAREVARNVLPLSLYSSFYVTLNLRSLFNFLSLRRVTDHTTVPTFPLFEIAEVAAQMEEHAASIFPVAMELFNEHGRVSP